MIWNDFLLVVQWWFMLFVVGFAFLPMAALLFSRFADKGYAFSKIIGVIVTSYIVYALGTLKIIPFTQWTIYGVFGIVCAVILFLGIKFPYFKALKIKRAWVLFIFEELLFFISLLFWSYVRGHNPEVYGLEKYMDFGFVNSILRSEYFPPKDMWFTPFSINYYYFGHLITAVLTKASFIPSYISYNLMLASLFAWAVTHSFSLGYNLWHAFTEEKKKKEVSPQSIPAKMLSYPFRSALVVGIIAAALVALSGNLHILYSFFKPYENDKPVPLWQLELSLFSESDAVQSKMITDPKTGEQRSVTYTPTFAFPNSYWYPNATRFIYNTIHEFPIYSWVVADLHGHVLDIPHVLLTIAILFSFYLWIKQNHSRWKEQFGYVVVIGFMIAVMYMTNAWDGLTYLMLTGLIFLYIQWERVHGNKQDNTTHNPILPVAQLFVAKTSRLKNFFLKHTFLDMTVGLCTYLFVVAAAFIVFSLPFSSNFDPSAIVSGVGVLCSPKFLTDLKYDIPADDGGTTTVTGQLGPILFEKDHCQKSPWWQLVILYGFFYFFVTVFLVYLSRVKKWLRSDIFVLLLIIVSTILIILPEFVYMKDIYPAHYRANTMFKLVFQAFMMLSICSAYIMHRTIIGFREATNNVGFRLMIVGYVFFIIFLLTLVLTYPTLAIKSYYGNLETYHGLDGLRYLQARYTHDYEGILWLRKNVTGQPVILESQGDSYTDHARVSANTGLPTVLGWTVHEWLWRGTYDIPSPRITEVQTLYESADIQATKNLIKKYKIEYVFAGELDRQKYPQLNDAKFEELGDVVFNSGNTTIYKVSGIE